MWFLGQLIKISCWHDLNFIGIADILIFWLRKYYEKRIELKQRTCSKTLTIRRMSLTGVIVIKNA